jgi:hypothetical protein
MHDVPPRPKTHYEILKVEPGVSADDLKAAYRILSRRYHPDRHPAHPDAAARIMASINVAYDVLSDPERRAAYDWQIGVSQPRTPVLRRSRVRSGQPANTVRGAYPASTGASAVPGDFSMRRRAMAVRRLMAASVLSCLAALFIIGWMVLAPGEEGAEPDLSRMPDAMVPRVASPTGTAGEGGQPADRGEGRASAPVAKGLDIDKVHIRPLESPAGLPWPSVSGELAGHARLFATGYNGLLLDNRLGPSDVFVKVYQVDSVGLVAARHAFVRARDRLLLNDFPPGAYEVHYFSLDTGQSLRSLTLQLGASVADGSPLEFRLDDMQGRSGRAVPITKDVFHSSGLILKSSSQLSTGTADPVR